MTNQSTTNPTYPSCGITSWTFASWYIRSRGKTLDRNNKSDMKLLTKVHDMMFATDKIREFKL